MRDTARAGIAGSRSTATPTSSNPRALWDALGVLDVPVVVTFLADRLETFAARCRRLPRRSRSRWTTARSPICRTGIPDELAALAAFPNVYLKVSTHALRSAAKGGDPADAIAELAARFDGRIMWGSDFSQTHDVPYAELAEEGRRAAAKLSDDASRGVLRRERNHPLARAGVTEFPNGTFSTLGSVPVHGAVAGGVGPARQWGEPHGSRMQLCPFAILTTHSRTMSCWWGRRSSALPSEVRRGSRTCGANCGPGGYITKFTVDRVYKGDVGKRSAS